MALDDLGLRQAGQGGHVGEVRAHLAAVGDRDRAETRRRPSARATSRQPARHGVTNGLRIGRERIELNEQAAKARDGGDHAGNRFAMQLGGERLRAIGRGGLDQQRRLAEGADHAGIGAVTLTPAASSARRTAATISTAPGVSPWQQMLSARIATRLPSEPVTDPRGRDLHRSLGGDGGIGDDGAWLASGLERAIGLVGSVGEGLGHEAEAGVCGGGRHRLRGGQPEQQQVAAEAADRPRNGRCKRRIRRGLVVERAVRLDVLHLHALRATERLERPDLVPHEGLDLVRLEGHRPAAEPEQIRVAGLRAHRHTRAAAQRDRRLHDPEVAGMEAAGEVRAGEVRHEPLVVAERPAPVALAKVGVEVHSRHPTAPLAAGVGSST